VLSDGRWYLLNVAEQIINCKNIDGGGGGETEEERGKDYDTKECQRLRESGMTREGFERLKEEWRTRDTSTGTEQGSLWMRDNEFPTGFDFVPMTPIWGDNGNPAMNLPEIVTYEGRSLVAMSHIHQNSYLKNGVGPWTNAEWWKSSATDRARAFEHQIPSYIGTSRSLFVYQPDPYSIDRGKDVWLMGAKWWDKDCF